MGSQETGPDGARDSAQKSAEQMFGQETKLNF